LESVVFVWEDRKGEKIGDYIGDATLSQCWRTQLVNGAA